MNRIGGRHFHKVTEQAPISLFLSYSHLIQSHPWRPCRTWAAVPDRRLRAHQHPPHHGGCWHRHPWTESGHPLSWWFGRQHQRKTYIWQPVCHISIRAISEHEENSNLSRRHHHSSTNSIQRVRSNTSTSGDSPAEQEWSKEVTLKSTDEHNRLNWIVHAKVETAIDNDANDRRHESTVEASNTIGGKGLLIDIHQSVELALTTLLRVLGIIGQSSTGIIKRINEQQRGGPGSLCRY